MKSNSGREKAPTPKAVAMFKGIKGLVASGPGMTKKVNNQKLRPEGAVHIDAGNLKVASDVAKAAAGSPKSISMGSGHKGILVPHNPEPAIKRDSASVLKPHTN